MREMNSKNGKVQKQKQFSEHKKLQKKYKRTKIFEKWVVIGCNNLGSPLHPVFVTISQETTKKPKKGGSRNITNKDTTPQCSRHYNN